MEPVKVLHLRASPFIGSPEKLLLGRLKYMDRNSCQYLVGIFNEQDRTSNDFSKSLEVMGCLNYLLYDSMIFFIFNFIKLQKIILQNKITVVCTHDYKSNFYGLFLCKLLKVPVIAVYHGRTGVDLKVRLFERFDNFILHFFNSIICVSTNTANRVKSSLSKVPIFVIQNAVDIVQINTLSTETEDQLSLLKKPNKKLIVYAGRLCARKGLFNLIKAFIITLSKRKDIILAILGDGPDKQKISNMITSSNLSEYIHLLGFKKNIYSYYNAMEFLVLPSLSEEMPVVILEAFALHKPVVATNVGGIPEIVQHNVSGILVGPENSKELADAMDYLLSNPDITSKMGNKGFETVHAHHTFESQAIKYFSAYNKTLSDNLL